MVGAVWLFRRNQSTPMFDIPGRCTLELAGAGARGSHTRFFLHHSQLNASRWDRTLAYCYTPVRRIAHPLIATPPCYLKPLVHSLLHLGKFKTQWKKSNAVLRLHAERRISHFLKQSLCWTPDCVFMDCSSRRLKEIAPNRNHGTKRKLFLR